MRITVGEGVWWRFKYFDKEEVDDYRRFCFVFFCTGLVQHLHYQPTRKYETTKVIHLEDKDKRKVGGCNSEKKCGGKKVNEKIVCVF